MNERSTDTPQDQQAVLRELILGYLREHPRAMDSLQGIADWWIPRHQVRVDVERVAEALTELQELGLVERDGDADQPLFRLRRVAAGPNENGQQQVVRKDGPFDAEGDACQEL